MPNEASTLTSPPFCQYADGPCDQDLSGQPLTAFFIYPSQPTHLARTVTEAVRQLQSHSSPDRWLTWEALAVGGQIVFCEICKAIRRSSVVVANITTMNFNVLFELGYAIGLRKPVLPVRDSTFERPKKLFDEIGIFDTLGYEEFTNSRDLQSVVTSKRPYSAPVHVNPESNRGQPIYCVKSPINTDGSIRLLSCLKKSYFRFRTFDARETPRLSLHDAYRQVLSSVSVVAHLLDPDRTGADAHNARAAFVCGLALAAQKHVLMLQEGRVTQPIDYRDIVFCYTDPASIPPQVEHIVRLTAETIQRAESSQVPLPTGILERLDLGDVAAENEIQALATYFVKTPQFQQARQGHARLVIGRKGSGKSALFYGIRSQLFREKRLLILDLKPEGHQFTRLREIVLSQLTEGLQLHTLTAFWHYLLVVELAHKILDRQRRTAWDSPEALREFKALESLCGEHVTGEGDFSERLMALVNRVVERFPIRDGSGPSSSEITQAVYGGDITRLNSMLEEYLASGDGVWVLFDNIDKGFPTHGLHGEDILIVRSLLEALRRLQRTFDKRRLACFSAVFIRKDVFDLLIDTTPDRGKEPYVSLDWSDVELIKELLLRRFRFQVPELAGSFDDVWGRLFDPHVGGESSFRYVLGRTFLRPRDILNFVRKCIQVAVSRSHVRVEQEDILSAEGEFSEDVINELRYEMRDVFAEWPDLILAFLGAEERLSQEEVDLILFEAGVPEPRLGSVREALLWFSFLGIVRNDEEFYSYGYMYSLPKLMALIKDATPSEPCYVIHPAFRKAISL